MVVEKLTSIVIMFSVIRQRLVLPQTWRSQATQTTARSLFSTYQQVYPVSSSTATSTRHTAASHARESLFAYTSRQMELSKTLFEISQMRVIPPQLAEKLQEPVAVVRDVEPLDIDEWHTDSVLRKRRLKMKKHKLRKRRKAQRALRRKLKKD